MRFHALVRALSALLPGSFRGCASGAMAVTSPFLLGDSIKTAMANERTFFKWLFFGFHIGAVRCDLLPQCSCLLPLLLGMCWRLGFACVVLSDAALAVTRQWLPYVSQLSDASIAVFFLILSCCLALLFVLLFMLECRRWAPSFLPSSPQRPLGA